MNTSAMVQKCTWQRCCPSFVQLQVHICNHERVTDGLGGVQFYFSLPHHPWQQGTNENTNELLRKYFPDDYDDNYYTDALPQDGDGIALADGAGAALTNYCTIVKENAYSCNSRLDAPNRAAHQGCSLWINARGERFHDESDTFSNESTNSLVLQPGKIGYALYDENVLSTMEAMLADHVKKHGPIDRMQAMDFGELGNNVINIFDAVCHRHRWSNARHSGGW